jgi:hypothetical protein
MLYHLHAHKQALHAPCAHMQALHGVEAFAGFACRLCMEWRPLHAKLHVTVLCMEWTCTVACDGYAVCGFIGCWACCIGDHTRGPLHACRGQGRGYNCDLH